MRFHLSPEQTAIQDAVRRTLAEKWPMERLHAFADGDEDLDRLSWEALMELGLAGLLLPESGMGLLDAALACEMIGEAAGNGPIIGQILAVWSVSRSNLGDRFLRGLSSGELVAALALGDRPLIEAAGSADLFLVGDPESGISLIETGPSITIEPLASTDRSRPVSRVNFGEAQRIPLFAGGDLQGARLFDAALILIAADALGGAQRCTDLSVEYGKTREQFGHAIGQFQGLKHQLAHMALDVEPARALVWYAAYAWDAELPDASRAAAMAKAHLCEVYVRTTRAAIAAHGGIGYTWEYGLNYWFRRSIQDGAMLGSPAEHRVRAADMAGW